MALIDKETRYDRQLRLWASSGQANLEASHICLINATTTGLEALKNLVLPGAGDYTIIDESVITEQNLAGSFFLDQDDIGEKIAVVASSRLNELNSDVRGHYDDRSVHDILTQETPDFWNKFSVVVISDYFPFLDELVNLLWEKGIPLVVVNCLGFYGSLQLIMNETTVIETHDPSKVYDLRIDEPWLELKQFTDSFELDDLDDTDHAHVPYVLILIKALQRWKDSHHGQSPQNYLEKKQFRKDVEGMSRRIGIEANFLEATNSIHKALQTTRIPQSIMEIFNQASTNHEKVTKSTLMFWLLVVALKRFVQKNDFQLPLPGTLPDMASDTLNYIQLQNIYKNKAIRDETLFKQELTNVLKEADRSIEDISGEVIKSFCRNSQFLYVTNGSKEPYSQNLMFQLFNEPSEGDDERSSTLAIYFTILNYNKYIDTFKTCPEIEDLDRFIELFLQSFAPHLKEVPESLLLTFKEALTHSIHNYHNINSFMGGVASQEVLKLATGQYIPVDNLFVFDGIRSVSDKWKI
ncbi:uncharacterized protein PRCAT00003811001 [Priceomyces carsonii]|uniref:uncharacterized protein n=1 Tax=Priceomyces carsonii TaxID=28549 RepID=UPI002ED84BC3|nr:unnamed protein product [Priceomyces carsonii]